VTGFGSAGMRSVGRWEVRDGGGDGGTCENPYNPFGLG
jgi:hypothetical protein